MGYEDEQAINKYLEERTNSPAMKLLCEIRAAMYSSYEESGARRVIDESLFEFSHCVARTNVELERLHDTDDLPDFQLEYKTGYQTEQTDFGDLISIARYDVATDNGFVTYGTIEILQHFSPDYLNLIENLTKENRTDEIPQARKKMNDRSWVPEVIAKSTMTKDVLKCLEVLIDVIESEYGTTI